MTASRNTILAFGLMLLALTAGTSARGATCLACSGTSSDASGGTGGQTSSGTAANSTGDCGCNAGCALCGAAGDPDRGATPCWEREPLFQACEAYLRDFHEVCAGCTRKAEASVLYMHRATPGTAPVLLDTTSTNVVFGASNMEFPYAAGPRVSFTVLDCEGWGLEGNYFGIDGWSTSTDFLTGALPNGAGNLVVDSTSTITLSNAHFESIARIYSAELNLRKPLFGNLSCLAGFRWLQLMDQYVGGGTSYGVTATTVSEKILTHNNLYGSQIGVDGTVFPIGEHCRINGFIKAGAFLNSADQATSFSEGQTSSAVNNSHQGIAFFGETGLIGYAQLTKHLAASGGYQVMFVNNVAQPVNQLGGMTLATSTANVDTSSGLFYHGASAGLELTW